MDKKYLDYYKSKIQTGDPVIASGWGKRNILEMLYLLNHIQKALTLEREDVLMDIGCGAGIFSIGLSAQVKFVIAGDFIPEMVKYASQLTAGIHNISMIQMNILEPDFERLLYLGESCNKILMNSVLQAMPSDELMVTAIKNTKKLLSRKGKILLGSNADRSKKDEYIKGYYKLNLARDELFKKVEEQKKAIWVDKDFIVETAKKEGFKVSVLNLPEQLWQSWYMFDLLLEMN